MTPCAGCLRRSWLVGLLSVRIATLHEDRKRARSILALGDEALIEAVGGSVKSRACRLLEDFDAAAAREGIAAAGLHAVCRHEPEFPEPLLQLADAPPLLHTTAPPPRLAELCEPPTVAVVGTRRASGYGLEVARAMGRDLAAAGVTVVSGLALGIDAAAHRGALDAGGPTLAVLGCGADRAYPRTNRSLYARIREHGAAIAELPPGAPPARWTFPARNRIMAGIASVTVVVEAAARSGSLITAGFAEDLNRDVCAVPGRVTSRIAAGANQLLKDGAQTVRGADDVLDLVFGAGCWERRTPDPRALHLDAPLRRVLAAVENGDSVEEAAVRSDMSASTLRAALGRLELLGLIRADGFGAYERVAAS